MFFTEWRAESILLFKTYWLAFRIKMGFVDKDRVKVLAMRNYLEYLARLMKGKIITLDEACDLLYEASQKIQAL